MNDKAYISWLEERVVRLECELAELNDRHTKTLNNHIFFLDNLTQSLKNA
jgi:predicted amino acid racemase